MWKGGREESEERRKGTRGLGNERQELSDDWLTSNSCLENN